MGDERWEMGVRSKEFSGVEYYSSTNLESKPSLECSNTHPDPN